MINDKGLKVFFSAQGRRITDLFPKIDVMAIV